MTEERPPREEPRAMPMLLSFVAALALWALVRER
jgi:hypothetical protein